MTLSQESLELKRWQKPWTLCRSLAFSGLDFGGVRVNLAIGFVIRAELRKASLTKGPFCRGHESVTGAPLSQSWPWFAKVPKSAVEPSTTSAGRGLSCDD
jgi:hypothetical protein